MHKSERGQFASPSTVMISTFNDKGGCVTYGLVLGSGEIDKS